MLYLDLTARNDWSSTLPDADPYFYPSAALSVLVSEMLDLPEPFSLVKLRGGYASVGNDANPYQLLATLHNAGAWGDIPRLTLPSALLNPTLKPEIATSYEGGIDLHFFNDRLRFSGTYYKVQNENQILGIDLPPSTGYTSKRINAGLLQSEGVELSLGTDIIRNNNWDWSVNLNLTRNRTKIIELADNMPYYPLWSDARGAHGHMWEKRLGIFMMLRW